VAVALALGAALAGPACTALNRQVQFNPPPAEVSGEGFCMPIEGSVSSLFGGRSLGGEEGSHKGVDFTGRWLVTPVFAAREGLVTVVARSRSYGLWIEIQHAAGWATRYAHLSWQHVRQGQRVRRGDLVGRIGSSGRSTGTHLHFEVRHDGTPVDPFSVLPGGQTPGDVPRVRLRTVPEDLLVAGVRRGETAW